MVFIGCLFRKFGLCGEDDWGPSVLVWPSVLNQGDPVQIQMEWWEYQLHRDYRMDQAPHFKTHSPGWGLISSLFRSLTLRALSLSSQQSWMCFSSVSAHFNDLFSLVSCTWKAGSLLWSSYLSHAQPVVAGPKCPAWFSQAPVPKSILWWSLTTDLQRSDITETIWIFCSLLAPLICPDLFPYRVFSPPGLLCVTLCICDRNEPWLSYHSLIWKCFWLTTEPCKAQTYCLWLEKKTVSFFLVCVALQKHYQPVMAHCEIKHRDDFEIHQWMKSFIRSNFGHKSVP